MGEFTITKRARVLGASVCLAALSLGACTTVEQTRSRPLSDAGHATAGYLPRDMAAARRSVLASLGRDELPGLAFAAAQSHRASIGTQANGAVAGHEADFAKETTGLAAGVNIHLQSEPIDALNVLAQNTMQSSGGWRVDGDGVVHDYSGMRCPKVLNMLLADEAGNIVSTVDAYLTKINLYDSSGQDTSCDFFNEARDVFITLYASNWPNTSLTEHYSAALKLIVDQIPLKEEAKVLIASIETEPESLIEGETLAAAFITQPISDKTYKTALWLNKTGPWHVKARATFKIEDTGQDAAPTLVEMVATTMHAIALNEVDEHTRISQTVAFRVP